MSASVSSRSWGLENGSAPPQFRFSESNPVFISKYAWPSPAATLPPRSLVFGRRHQLPVDIVRDPVQCQVVTPFERAQDRNRRDLQMHVYSKSLCHVVFA